MRKLHPRRGKRAFARQPGICGDDRALGLDDEARMAHEPDVHLEPSRRLDSQLPAGSPWSRSRCGLREGPLPLPHRTRRTARARRSEVVQETRAVRRGKAAVNSADRHLRLHPPPIPSPSPRRPWCNARALFASPRGRRAATPRVFHPADRQLPERGNSVPSRGAQSPVHYSTPSAVEQCASVNSALVGPGPLARPPHASHLGLGVSMRGER